MSSVNDPNKMPNPIAEWFSNREGNKDFAVSRELFQGEPDSVDLRTDLDHREIILINNMFFNDQLLGKRGFPPLYTLWLNKYMRLKISHKRQSRSEFVNVNASSENSLKIGDFQTKGLTEAKK
jgi:hypothetical protein